MTLCPIVHHCDYLSYEWCCEYTLLFRNHWPKLDYFKYKNGEGWLHSLDLMSLWSVVQSNYSLLGYKDSFSSIDKHDFKEITNSVNPGIGSSHRYKVTCSWLNFFALEKFINTSFFFYIYFLFFSSLKNKLVSWHMTCRICLNVKWWLYKMGISLK